MDWISVKKREPAIGSYIWAKNGDNSKTILGYVIKGLTGLQIDTLQGIRNFTHWSTYEVEY